MSRLGYFYAFFIVFASPGALPAQLSGTDRPRLIGEIRAAADHLDADLLPDFVTSKSEFLERVATVEQFFTANTTAENRDAWLEYLHLDPLVEAIKSEQSPGVMAREALDLHDRLVGTTPGLELTALRQLRDSTEQLFESILFRDKEKSIASLAKQLDSLAQRVGQLDDNPSANDFAAVSAVLGLLESSGQADRLMDSFRDTFSRPNVAILVGESMIQTAANQNVSRTSPVRDCILGTRIFGSATLNGIITADLLPSVGAAKVNVTLVGKIVSHNRGYNRPVRLRTVAYGDVNLSRTMMVNESGITLEPVYSRAVLRTKILAIEHNLAIVRAIARKRTAQQKPQADRIAVERMRNRAGAQFALRTSEATEIMPQDLLVEIRPLLKRLSLEEPTRLWGSTDEAIVIDTMFRGHDQLSTVVPRPLIGESYDAAVQIHESAIENAFATVLAGRTLSETRLNELLESAGRPMPETDIEGESGPPFEIDFSRLRPIIFEARDQTVRLGVRGKRFAQGKRELKQAMEITALYEPAKNDDGVAILRRHGDVTVDFPGGKRLTLAQAGLRRSIQKKFSEVFPETLLSRQIEIPSDAEIEAIRGHVFRSRLVDARDGWLTIASR
jgi:hypothetical protein